MNEWQGEERRAIPIHILNHIDSRLSEHADRVENQLGETNRRIQNLTLSINSWMEKEPAALADRLEDIVDEMIPPHPDNKDATKAEKRHEHRKAHASWIKRIEEEMSRWKRLRERVAEWAIVGALAFVVMAVWKLFLEGPK